MAMSLGNACLRASKTRFSATCFVKQFVHARTIHKSANLWESWQLVSAVCLERLPVITSELKPMEAEYQQLLVDQELEDSLRCDHELRQSEDLRIAEMRKKEDYEETEADAVRQTAVEAEDQWENELNAFTPASRLTEADKKNDQKSTERSLDSRLVLAVKQKLGDKSHWTLPMSGWVEGESMRQAAERTLSEMCGSDLQTRFMGNAPVGFFKYRFPQDQQADGKVGAKVFFFKAQVTGGSVAEVKEPAEDYLWLTKDELLKHLTPQYAAAVDKFVLEL